MKGLAEKNVLVTGATSGIGQAIAVRFAKEGANVAINYRKSPEDASDTEKMIYQACTDARCGCGGKEILVQGDVSKEEDVIGMFASIKEELGGIDILINNAGIQIAGAAHEISTEDFLKVIDVNLKGAYFCAREAIKQFLSEDKNGIIINVSSVHQIIPRPEYISYSISKGGIQNLTRTLALEYARKKIRVNAIAPGATITPINDAWTNDPEKKANVESHIPMGRVGTSEEMAAIASFLCSDEAAYITGQTLFVDGGLTLYPDFQDPWSGQG
ncbi:MAG: glucose 1-dehydrogenase [Cyanobacteria bacterium P01_A01_bin.84]